MPAESLTDIIKRRREEARSRGRIIHPEPLIAEIRKRRKMLKAKPAKPTTLNIVVERTGDFIEAVATNLRDPIYWASYAAQIVSAEILERVPSIRKGP